MNTTPLTKICTETAYMRSSSLKLFYENYSFECIVHDYATIAMASHVILGSVLEIDTKKSVSGSALLKTNQNGSSYLPPYHSDSATAFDFVHSR